MSNQVSKFKAQEYDPSLNDEEAAKVLSSTKHSVRQSRHNGFLYGKPAPQFVKLGRKVRYRLSALYDFLEQFPEYRSTSEFSDSKEVL